MMSRPASSKKGLDRSHIVHVTLRAATYTLPSINYASSHREVRIKSV